MTLKSCNSKSIRAAERATGLHIVGLMVPNGYDRAWFITHDHRHGWWDRMAGGRWELDPAQEHWASCLSIFPIPPEGHSWGEIDKTGRWRATGRPGRPLLVPGGHHEQTMAGYLYRRDRAVDHERQEHRARIEALALLVRYFMASSPAASLPLEHLPDEVRQALLDCSAVLGPHQPRSMSQMVRDELHRLWPNNTGGTTTS